MAERSYQRWTEDEELEMLNLFRAGMMVEQVAEVLERTLMAVLARLARHGRLGFIDDDQRCVREHGELE